MMEGDINIRKEIENIAMQAGMRPILNEYIPTHKIGNALD